MNGNGLISWILRSPLHGMLSNGMMLITVTGRKTGKKYTTPVGYFRKNGTLWVLTSRNRTWWKNLQGGAEVALLLKRQPISALAEPALDPITVQAQMREYIKQIPQAARSMQIRMEDGIPNAEDLEHVAENRLFVRVTPQ